MNVLVGYSAGNAACLLEGFGIASVATLYKLGINRYVDVPEEISRALGGKGYIPVIANAQGFVLRTTLVPGVTGSIGSLSVGKFARS